MEWEDILFNNLKRNCNKYNDYKFEMFHRPLLVADAPLIWKIIDSKGVIRSICMSSNRLYPESIKNAAVHANLAANSLSGQDKQHVLLPEYSGEVDGISYAVYPYCTPLPNSKLGWWFQKGWLQRSVYSWLISTLKQTMSQTKTTERAFQDALTAVIDCDSLSQEVRRDGEVAMGRLENHQWIPKQALTHNDLWKGNILKRDGIFVLIDWGASQVKGFPIYDLTRYSISLNVSSKRFRHELREHCNVLKCSLEDSTGYLLASLGHILLNLDQFPMEKYIELTHECHSKLLSIN